MRTNPTSTAVPAAERERLRALLAETRQAYLGVLDSLSAEDWRRPSANPAWTNGELLGHLALSFGLVPRMIARARRGRDMPRLPESLFNAANVALTRLSARRYTRSTLARRYDAAYAAVLAALEGVRDDEWERRARLFGGERETVAGVIQSQRRHFEEHAAQLRRGEPQA